LIVDVDESFVRIRAAGLWTGRPGGDPGICRSPNQSRGKQEKAKKDTDPQRIHKLTRDTGSYFIGEKSVGRMYTSST
jgi:hypothetical protein